MSKRKAEWQNRYIAKTYDRINLLVPRGNKEAIKVHAGLTGESMLQFINRAIQEAMERDSQKAGD